jgi:hypothetical protein
MTTYSKDLEWLRPYVDSVRKLVPHVEGVDSIKSYRISKLKNESSEAWCHLQDGRFHIRLKNYYHIVEGRDIKLVTEVKREYVAKVLDSLAHELAHTTEWEHTPRHFRLQALILVQFSLVLEDQGVTDTWARWATK